ncbi:hypothetical protein HNY73_016289 [Argiope bruennichi]|uniref:Uncharacterized protein n=1 Tax=Argiope bruennichi TaxID=94029 RepID=A0A8T0EN72_ARGBR|nr:hypothetical protein HNY73_016289 [Argiope bruennichi]
MLIDNHTHMRHIMLYRFEKGEKQSSHFAISTNFLVRTQSAKVDAGNGLPVSNLAIVAWKMRQKEVNFVISTTRHFWKLDNSNTGRQLQCGTFNHPSSSQRARKGMDRSITIKTNVSDFSPICYNEMRGARF